MISPDNDAADVDPVVEPEAPPPPPPQVPFVVGTIEPVSASPFRAAATPVSDIENSYALLSHGKK